MFFNIYIVYFIGYFLAFLASILTLAYSFLILKENFEKYMYLNVFEVMLLSVTNIVLFVVSVKIYALIVICFHVAMS